MLEGLILEVAIGVGLLGELVAVGFGLASVVGVGSTCGVFVGSGVIIRACCATVPVPILEP